MDSCVPINEKPKNSRPQSYLDDHDTMFFLVLVCCSEQRYTTNLKHSSHMLLYSISYLLGRSKTVPILQTKSRRICSCSLCLVGFSSEGGDADQSWTMLSKLCIRPVLIETGTALRHCNRLRARLLATGSSK